jgi:hypothetical protein
MAVSLAVLLRGVAQVVTAKVKTCFIRKQAWFEETLGFGSACVSDGIKELED